MIDSKIPVIVSEAGLIHRQIILIRIQLVTTKTKKERNLFRSEGGSGKKSKTKIVSDNTVAAKGLQDSF